MKQSYIEYWFDANCNQKDKTTLKAFARALTKLLDAYPEADRPYKHSYDEFSDIMTDYYHVELEVLEKEAESQNLLT
jgi:hypothetical protein